MYALMAKAPPGVKATFVDNLQSTLDSLDFVMTKRDQRQLCTDM